MLRLRKPLTPREERLYALIGDGLERQDISRVSGITRNSLQVHIDRLYSKILFPGSIPRTTHGRHRKRLLIMEDREKMKAELLLPGAD